MYGTPHSLPNITQRRVIICLAVPAVVAGCWLVHRVLHPRHYRVIILPSLGGDITIGRTINDHGQIVGAAETEDGDYHLVMWDQKRKLHDLGLSQKSAGRFYINNAGQIAGSIQDPNGDRRTFVRDPNGYMHWLPTFISVAGLNNKGQIAGTAKDADGVPRAFLWDRVGGLRDLGDRGGKETRALAINDRGQVLGRGHTATNHLELFLWDPNDGVKALEPPHLQDLNNNSYAVGWHSFGRNGTYLVTCRADRGVTKLFKDERVWDDVLANDANQVVCRVTRHNRWERFSKRFFGPWQTYVLWDPNEGSISLDEQLSQRRRRHWSPSDLNNHGCIVATLFSRAGTKGQAVLMEPVEGR